MANFLDSCSNSFCLENISVTLEEKTFVLVYFDILYTHVLIYPSLTYSVKESVNSLVDCTAFFFNCSVQIDYYMLRNENIFLYHFAFLFLLVADYGSLVIVIVSLTCEWKKKTSGMDYKSWINGEMESAHISK